MSLSSKTPWYLVKFKFIIVALHHQGGQDNQGDQDDMITSTMMTGKSSRDNVRMFQEGICQLFPSLRHIFISKEAMKVFFMIVREEWKGSITTFLLKLNILQQTKSHSTIVLVSSKKN